MRLAYLGQSFVPQNCGCGFLLPFTMCYPQLLIANCFLILAFVIDACLLKVSICSSVTPRVLELLTMGQRFCMSMVRLLSFAQDIDRVPAGILQPVFCCRQR